LALTIGVAALFFGVVFIIVGWKGGGTDNMNTNLAGMVKGQYPVGKTTPVTQSSAGTATTGGAHSPTKK
jgi:hypothetical protein